MNKIKFTFICCLVLFSHLAVADKFVVGKHYLKVPPKVRAKHDVAQLMAESPDKIQIVTFFSYGCYWCSKVNKPFDEWASKVGSDVNIKKLPVSFNRGMWHQLAKLYFTIHNFDNVDVEELDDEIFFQIHQKNNRLWLKDKMLDFFAKRGISREDFNGVFDSFNVKRQVKQADELASAYQAVLTPIFIVNGKENSYLTNLVMTDGSPERMFEVINYLVTRERS